MCDGCYDPTGGSCGCAPCLVNQGSNWCTVCCHHGTDIVVLAPPAQLVLLAPDGALSVATGDAMVDSDGASIALDERQQAALDEVRGGARPVAGAVTGVERTDDGWAVTVTLTVEAPPG